MATRMDRVIILIEITGNTTAKNEITANNIEIIVTAAGAVTITGIMTAAGLVATGIIAMAETEVTAITEMVADAKVLVEIFVKTRGVTGIITITNTEMAAETEVTTEGPPQIIMNPIITGIISIVEVVDDKDFFCLEVLDNAPEIYNRITDEKNSCLNLVSSALKKKKKE